MQRSAFFKELIRTITRKPGRFAALLAIVALGAGFYAGLRMTAPDMKASLDNYLDSTRTYDVRIVGTMGVSKENAEAIATLDTIDDVAVAYQADALALFGEDIYTVRIHSIPEAVRLTEEGRSINEIELVEGRLPTAPGECVVSADRVTGARSNIGATIRLTQAASSLNSIFSTREFEIVGKVRSANYVSSANIESSSLGSGVVQQYLYVTAESFAEAYPYTEVYATVKGAREVSYPSDTYDALIDTAIDQIRGIEADECDAYFDTLKNKMIARAFTFDGLFDLFAYRLELVDAEEEDMQPEWLVMGRDKNTCTMSFVSDADRVDHIASIFPFIFFLVAALVALTTMTRMVDEERMLAGTYKALGYSKRTISSKYLIYALAASGIGSVIGIAILAHLLPGVIMNAYAIMYTVPTTHLKVDMPMAFLSAGMSIAITMVATGGSIAATLAERPASLMLPRAPKSGKRILLERVGPLWSRLSFIWKVTCRNIFRYKPRFIMTVAGIAGCTALLLTGWGLHDAINDIIDLQYGEIINHNAAVSLQTNMREADALALDELIEGSPAITKHTDAYRKTMLASGPRAENKRIDLVVPFDEDEYFSMMLVRTRIGHEPLSLKPGKAILNEKMATELGLKVGDRIKIAEQDAMGNATSTAYEFEIGALTENYIYNYLYVDAQTYREVVGHAPKRTVVLLDVVGDSEIRANLDEQFRAIDGVRTVGYNDEVIDTYRTMLRSVDLIVVVLVVSAAALAFIVLYNLTNINIEERIREIATLKVLGFTKRETSTYIFREIALLALIGAGVGLLLGIGLESFVVTTAEVDQVMFGRSIHPFSFVISYILTLVFSAVSCALMVPKISKVDMVMSLKSNE